MPKIKIDNQELDLKAGTTILEAAGEAQIKIPTLCHLEGLSVYGGCRLCVVEVIGEELLQAACSTKVKEGMQIKTHSKKVRETRKNIFELIISSHDIDCKLNCLTCFRSTNCELREVGEQLDLEELSLGFIGSAQVNDSSSYAIVREPSKCIVCARCIRQCEEKQGIGIFTKSNRGPKTMISTFKDKGLGNVDCTSCGQCIHACPTGALHGVYHYHKVWEALSEASKFVVVQTAPSLKVSLAEGFAAEGGVTIVTGQMVNALKRLGFDRVFDTSFAVDLALVEKSHQFRQRIKKGENLPLFTSSSPAWIKFLEHFYPQYLSHLSSCKSPQQILGALTKNYYARKYRISKEDIVVVSVLPCTAAKFEISRPELNGDVDYALTVRELISMIREVGLDLMNLSAEKYDSLLGASSAMAALSGVSGGMLEGILSTFSESKTGDELNELDFGFLRQSEGIKEGELEVGDLKLKVAAVNGLGNAHTLMKKIEGGESYHLVEMMACPSGCVGGGGHPIPTNQQMIGKRAQGLYSLAEEKKLKKASQNPELKQLYADFLGEIGGPKARELLHTSYISRSI